MTRYVDLHCHYLPGLDDGVRTLEDGIELCRELRALGFERVVATPHMRAGLFENDRASIERKYILFQSLTREIENLPETGIGAEHFFDDVFVERFRSRQVMPYEGGRAILLELPAEAIPLGLEAHIFAMSVRRVRTVLAHPERYAAFQKKSDRLDPLLDQGVLPLLDVMSLIGHYGKAPMRTAERLLEEGAYYAACTDCHRPSDVPRVDKALERLRALVGGAEVEELLDENPRRILEGRIES